MKIEILWQIQLNQDKRENYTLVLNTYAVSANRTGNNAALGYTFLGTSKDNREKMVGPRKALTKPPRKTKK